MSALPFSMLKGFKNSKVLTYKVTSIVNTFKHLLLLNFFLNYKVMETYLNLKSMYSQTGVLLFIIMLLLERTFGGQP